jgi:hypothetical protein
MGLFARLRAVFRVLRRKKRPLEAVRLLKQRPALLVGVNLFETALVASGRVDSRVKALAQVKTSSLIGCPF